MADVPGAFLPVPFLVREGVSPVRSRERREGGGGFMKRFLKSLWYSPALIAVLVFVLGAPRKIPR
jgi:hypothetical protein